VAALQRGVGLLIRRSIMDYEIYSRDYLIRARQRLREGTKEALFYAALELRFGIEQRMTQYLQAWQHTSKSKKAGWRIAELARGVEQAFRLGNKIVRFAVHHIDSRALLAVFYYTPVTPTLQRHGERLGNYLHSMKSFRKGDDPWWREFREDLEMIAGQLELANRGTLLGPPLMKGRTGLVEWHLEAPPGTNPKAVLQTIRGSKRFIFDVSYLDRLPTLLEAEAQVWNLGS